MSEPTVNRRMARYYESGPRYVRVDGKWYLSREFVAEQLKVAIESAFLDGVKFATGRKPKQRTPIVKRARAEQERQFAEANV